MTTSSSSNGNVNLRLNHITIDEVIRRAALNSGVSQEQLEEDLPALRGQYGKLVLDGKVGVYRPDINSSLTKRGDTFNIDEEGLSKIEASVPTILELLGYGARIVAIAHQGSFGQEDCISLVPHHQLLEDRLGRHVPFVQGNWNGEPVQEAVRGMQPGQIVLLDNVRLFPVEVEGDGRTVRSSESFLNAPSSYTKILEGLADFVFYDGIPVVHRYQASVMGMPNLLHIAGRQAQMEIEALKAMSTENIRHPYTMILGGVKIIDYLDLIETSLQNGTVDKVLAPGASGIIVNLALMGQDQPDYFGKFTEEFLKKEGIYGQLARIREIARKYPDKLIAPLDFKVEIGGNVHYIDANELPNHPGKDIARLSGLGPKTVRLFKEVLDHSNMVYLKGPPTVYDDERFAGEAREITGKIVERHADGAITVLSGGHTNAMVRLFGYDKSDFSFVTLAGGAAMQYLNGTLLPGLLMLDASYRAFNGLGPHSGIGHLPIMDKFQAPTRIPELLRPR